MNDDMHKALNRMDDIAAVWQLIGDLACSYEADDMHLVDRDNFTNAVGFLAREYKTAREKLSECSFKEIGKSL